MPVPVAIPLSQLLGTASTGSILGKPSEDTTQAEPVVPFSEVLARQFLGPSSSILQKTIDTPSGKVFAPDEPTPAKPNILATYPQSKDQPWIMSSPMPAGEPQGIMSLPIPETQDKLKGFEKPQDVDMKILYKVENNKPNLTEVNLDPEKAFDITDTSSLEAFPFNPVDFKKNGILNNPEIIKAFSDLKNDVKIKPPVGFNEDYMVLQQSDSFYLTPPRAQMEITLKYLEKQLKENKASEETIDLIKTLNKNLQDKIKDTGYYGVNKKVEGSVTNLPGMTNKLNKLKSSN